MTNDEKMTKPETRIQPRSERLRFRHSGFGLLSDFFRHSSFALTPQLRLPLLLRHIRQPLYRLIKLLQIAPVCRQQPLERWHQIIVSRHRIELSVIDGAAEPLVVFRIPSPPRLQRGVFLPEPFKHTLLLAPRLLDRRTAFLRASLHASFFRFGVAVCLFQLFARVLNEARELAGVRE